MMIQTMVSVGGVVLGFQTAIYFYLLLHLFIISVKGVGTGGAMAPTLLKTVDFGPPTFQ